MIAPCHVCQFDWRQSELNVNVTLSKDVPDEIDTFCPVCGVRQRKPVPLASLGIVRRKSDRKLCQWATRRDARIALPGRAGPDDLGDFVDIQPRDVLFDAVPVFLDGDGRLLTGGLPVRPEFLDLVDFRQLRDRPGDFGCSVDERAARCRGKIAMLGLPAPLEVDLPLIGSDGRPTTQARRDAIQGFELTVWPDVRADIWKTFVVEARALGDARSLLDGTHPEVQHVHVAVRPALGGSVFTDRDEGDALTPLSRIEFCGFDRRGDDKPQAPSSQMARWAALATGGRPELLVISARGKSGKSWGTVFLPASARTTSAQTHTLTIGLDFGTSNSCIAFSLGQQHDQDSHVILRDCDAYEYLVAAHPRGGRFSAAEYCPRFPSLGFGPSGDILPSEIVTRWSRAVCLSLGIDEADQLRPGIDLGILGNDLDWRGGFDASNVVLKGLKWADERFRDGAAMDDKHRGAMVRAYLKTLLVQKVALLFRSLESSNPQEPLLPRHAQLRFGYPGSWAGEAILQLRKEVERALSGRAQRETDSQFRWGLRDWVNLDIAEVHSYDEATAAARVVSIDRKQTSNPAVEYVADLIVDIGGGSTDIALLWRPMSEQKPYIVESMTSLRYAGEDLFLSLLGPNAGGDVRNRCFVRGMSGAEMARHLRESGPTDDLFDPIKKGMTERRIRAFFFQLIEYLARLVAATLPNGQYRRRNEKATQLDVSLIRLGNGWGLASKCFPTIDISFASELERRICDIKDGLDADTQKFSVRVDPWPLPQDLHPKHAVAVGLLLENTQLDRADVASLRELAKPRDGKPRTDIVKAEQHARMKEWTFRSIVGLPTVELVREQGQIVRQRVIPWWEPVENNPHLAILEPDALFLWDLGRCDPAVVASAKAEGAVIEFPRTVIGTDPEGFEVLAAESQSDLMPALKAGGDRWFTQSPLSLFMESGLRHRLKSLV